ncbi:hypothetical protein DKX38_005342 [Salix brachista]|uniref:Uncharacterized protein n=1 Tax=Salix brachista TaxID=2182728 RepID=A0A5N5MZC1_9ROSI|nr:hypothetical protein DKX38_005342 [Salix brachista]
MFYSIRIDACVAALSALIFPGLMVLTALDTDMFLHQNDCDHLYSERREYQQYMFSNTPNDVKKTKYQNLC